MAEEIKDDGLNELSMNIIIHAGNARTHIMELLDAIEQADFSKCDNILELANKEINDAHRMQTDMIQKEAQGEQIRYSVLFNHAQDTLMTIKSEVILVSKMAKIFENIYKKLG